MDKILALIHKWHASIATKSKYKDDFVNIRAMYRLLTFKGYTFPPLDESEVLQLLPETTSLKTQEELLAEESLVRSTKLAEHLRRNTPSDLQAANELMKLMAGYDPEKKTDFQMQIQSQITRTNAKATLLRTLLSNGKSLPLYDPNIDELVQFLIASKPKMTKLADSELNDENMGKLFCNNFYTIKFFTELLLKTNDELNAALEEYDSLQRGIPTTKAISSSSSSSCSLIDFDTAPEPAIPFVRQSIKLLEDDETTTNGYNQQRNLLISSENNNGESNIFISRHFYVCVLFKIHTVEKIESKDPDLVIEAMVDSCNYSNSSSVKSIFKLTNISKEHEMRNLMFAVAGLRVWPTYFLFIR